VPAAPRLPSRPKQALRLVAHNSFRRLARRRSCPQNRSAADLPNGDLLAGPSHECVGRAAGGDLNLLVPVTQAPPQPRTPWRAGARARDNCALCCRAMSVVDRGCPTCLGSADERGCSSCHCCCSVTRRAVINLPPSPLGVRRGPAPRPQRFFRLFCCPESARRFVARLGRVPCLRSSGH
jgi:hypothetical protein